jgi:adiponectin receptor
MAAAVAEEAAAWEEEGSKGKKKTRKRYGLVEYRALPGYLRDNEYILRHYRCEWPLPQVLRSAFTIHNETLNVWTYVTRKPLSPFSFVSARLLVGGG